jgi:hypothetical protein
MHETSFEARHCTGGGYTSAMTPLRIELAQAAATFVADHGLDYGAAKTRALQERFGRARVPNQDIPGHRERVSSLRQSALRMMELLQDFEPLVTGAAWKGLASEQAFVHLQLFQESSKDLEYFLMNRSIPFEWSEMRRGAGLGGDKGTVPALVLQHRENPVVLAIYDLLHARGALTTRDRRGQVVRGNLLHFRARCAI